MLFEFLPGVEDSLDSAVGAHLMMRASKAYYDADVIRKRIKGPEELRAW